jgi:hypothetical protein
LESGGGDLGEVNLQTFSWRDNETPKTTGIKTALNTDKSNFIVYFLRCVTTFKNCIG